MSSGCEAAPRALPERGGRKTGGAAGGWTDCPFRFAFGRVGAFTAAANTIASPCLFDARRRGAKAALPFRFCSSNGGIGGDHQMMQVSPRAEVRAGLPEFCIPYVVGAAQNAPLRFAWLI